MYALLPVCSLSALCLLYFPSAYASCPLYFLYALCLLYFLSVLIPVCSLSALFLLYFLSALLPVCSTSCLLYFLSALLPVRSPVFCLSVRLDLGSFCFCSGSFRELSGHNDTFKAESCVHLRHMFHKNLWMFSTKI
ncbi:unnamed protein product [Menidia menidia]|uniref:(Atlantic silverside) hypothetical protein n=1 Tax=Menidia menidia TaxID=238744 RepID=A0A8S4BHZ2_9TELE|nr:unnamed protein product [Menidia menidia]